MAQSESRILRAALAMPFIGLAILCLRAMDTKKLIAHQQPFLEAGRITWDDGSMPVFERFYQVPFIDDLWRGTTTTFGASYIPLDAISWWQLFSFLNDLGPMYIVWFLESCRPGNSWTPIYTVTLFTFVAQLLGVGNVAPLYYFAHVTFAPSATALKRSAGDRRLRPEQALCILPLFLSLHTFEVVRAFTAPEPETRQYWVWAWQMSPFWIGVANALLSGLTTSVTSLRNSIFTSPRSLLVIMCAISSLSWLYTLSSSPYPLSDVFIPDSAVFSDFIGHTRKAMQCDEVYSFGSSFLWLIYMFFDLHAAGLVGTGSLVVSALLPLVAAATGPGTAFAIGWYWREQVLSSHKST
ncbi:hypothetical protein VPNG_10232 [Cytospora leucostoma]|uniref:Uncharacterized protein n=1 Tax=Cytospora leucostoma TaxID=1230097 RepID=A0A423VD05_9PEZI|nr:hypothetical protein VPNG_10232 [Cytospora leucostoma]